MSCPTFNIPPQGQQTQNTPKIDPNAEVNFILGKRIAVPSEFIEKQSKNNELEGVDDFEDWTLIRFSDKRNVKSAFFNFIGNPDGRERASKRRHGMNESIIKFAQVNPKFTIIHPPPLEDLPIG